MNPEIDMHILGVIDTVSNAVTFCPRHRHCYDNVSHDTLRQCRQQYTRHNGKVHLNETCHTMDVDLLARWDRRNEYV